MIFLMYLKCKIIKIYSENSGPQTVPNGMVWQQLALGERGVLLIEAKAHPAETKSDSKASYQKSKELISQSFARVQGFMGIEPLDWSKDFYQLANRIAHLYFFNEILRKPTWLVLVNFINDLSYKPTTLKEWVKHYNNLFAQMGIHHNCRLMDRVIMVYPPAI